MYKILEKKALNPQVTLMKIYAPRVAKNAKPGQFIILRIDENGERVPFTIADYDPNDFTVTIIFQIVGKTTYHLNVLNEGDEILDFAGPLGVPTHVPDNCKRVAVIGGGLGTAIAYPQAKNLYNSGIHVDSITGFRNADLVILQNEMSAVSSDMYTMTDDGSNGNKGFVTSKLQELIESGVNYDLVIAIGPLFMMRAVCNLTKEYGIKTIISMNPVMIDGTGMCGGCRLTVGGETKFACVDGPDFDGHLVDFDEAIRRQLMYKNHEKNSYELHTCKIGGDTNG